METAFTQIPEIDTRIHLVPNRLVVEFLQEEQKRWEGSRERYINNNKDTETLNFASRAARISELLLDMVNPKIFLSEGQQYCIDGMITAIASRRSESLPIEDGACCLRLLALATYINSCFAS